MVLQKYSLIPRNGTYLFRYYTDNDKIDIIEIKKIKIKIRNVVHLTKFCN